MHKSILFRTDPEIIAEVGERLRALRRGRKLSREAVAAQAGLNKSTVARAESGQNPTLLTIVRLLRVYGVLRAFESFIPEPPLSPLAEAEARRRGSDG